MSDAIAPSLVTLAVLLTSLQAFNVLGFEARARDEDGRYLTDGKRRYISYVTKRLARRTRTPGGWLIILCCLVAVAATWHQWYENRGREKQLQRRELVGEARALWGKTVEPVVSKVTGMLHTVVEATEDEVRTAQLREGEGSAGAVDTEQLASYIEHQFLFAQSSLLLALDILVSELGPREEQWNDTVEKKAQELRVIRDNPVPTLQGCSDMMRMFRGYSYFASEWTRDASSRGLGALEATLMNGVTQVVPTYRTSIVYTPASTLNSTVAYLQAAKDLCIIRLKAITPDKLTDRSGSFFASDLYYAWRMAKANVEDARSTFGLQVPDSAFKQLDETHVSQVAALYEAWNAGNIGVVTEKAGALFDTYIVFATNAVERAE